MRSTIVCSSVLLADSPDELQMMLALMGQYSGKWRINEEELAYCMGPIWTH